MLAGLDSGELDALSAKLKGVLSGKALARGVLWRALVGERPIAGLAGQISALTKVPLWLFFRAPRKLRPRSKRSVAIMGPKRKPAR